MGFVHLRTYSDATPGGAHFANLAEHAVTAGMKSLALTDRGNMISAVHFASAAAKRKIKPIIGQCFQLSSSADTPRHEIVLLSKNRTGYRNLLELSTLSSCRKDPALSLEELASHRDGLIALCGGSGLIPELILAGRADEAAEEITLLRDALGAEQLYLEMQYDESAELTQVRDRLARISRELGLQLAATGWKYSVS